MDIVMSFITRKVFKWYLLSSINLLWMIWYLKNSKKVINIRRILDAWNREIPSFTLRYPYFNFHTFLDNYKYWIHWIRKMDSREKLIFKDFNPLVLINQEEWFHLDLSQKEIPVIYYYYYFPDNEWIPMIIFDSIEHLKIYVSIIDSTSDKLINYIETITRAERLSISKERILKKNGGFEKVIIDEEGLRLNPEYLKQLHQD
jgi:hypothetical protein